MTLQKIKIFISYIELGVIASVAAVIVDNFLLSVICEYN